MPVRPSSLPGPPARLGVRFEAPPSAVPGGREEKNRGVTSPTLTFWGAAGTVTGSRFLVETGASRVLVDAGLYQGLRELRRRNWDDFPVDPTTLDGVVLTHAHLDHCGYLPRLVRGGLDAPVLCTSETAELAAIVLRDSAHLQEEDAAYATEAGISRHGTALPLYDEADVERTLPAAAPGAAARRRAAHRRRHRDPAVGGAHPRGGQRAARRRRLTRAVQR